MTKTPDNIPMDSKQDFLNGIFEYYSKISNNNIADNILYDLADQVSIYYHDQYVRFRNQYPKSVKRYSTFQLKDLDHPQTFEIVIKFFKNKFGLEYQKYSCLLLNMTETQLNDFEKNRQDFYNMF